jgi:hypothetical protein
MNLYARLCKLESINKNISSYIAITTGIPTSRMPLESVYFGSEFELITSTVSAAAARLAARVNSRTKPMLFLVNKNKR